MPEKIYLELKAIEILIDSLPKYGDKEADIKYMWDEIMNAVSDERNFILFLIEKYVQKAYEFQDDE